MQMGLCFALFLVCGCVAIWLPSTWGTLLSQLLILVVFLITWRAPEPWGWAGRFIEPRACLERKRWPWGLISCCGLVVVSLALIATVQLQGGLESQKIAAALLFIRDRDPVEALLVLVVAPVVEELYFRGSLRATVQRCFTEPRFGNGAAAWTVYLTSLIFWLFHIPFDAEAWREAWAAGAVPFSFGPFFLGVWCGSILERGESLKVAILAHFLANLFAPVWGALLVF